MITELGLKILEERLRYHRECLKYLIKISKKYKAERKLELSKLKQRFE